MKTYEIRGKLYTESEIARLIEFGENLAAAQSKGGRTMSPARYESCLRNIAKAQVARRANAEKRRKLKM
jgi:hypothetical protein